MTVTTLTILTIFSVTLLECHLPLCPVRLALELDADVEQIASHLVEASHEDVRRLRPGLGFQVDLLAAAACSSAVRRSAAVPDQNSASSALLHRVPATEERDHGCGDRMVSMAAAVLGANRLRYAGRKASPCPLRASATAYPHLQKSAMRGNAGNRRSDSGAWPAPVRQTSPPGCADGRPQTPSRSTARPYTALSSSA